MYTVAGVTNFSILGFCIAYCLLCLNTSIVFKDYREAINSHFDVLGNKIAVNAILLWLMCLQIPFKFFLEKEFLFILDDELRHRSISTNVIEI
jgi:amino acid transporter